MPRGMVGHLLNRPNYVDGLRGQAYDYILAQNGVFLEAESKLIKARIKVGDAEVRGLAPLTERVELVHGLVPTYFLAMALRTMRQDPTREVYLAVVCDDGFYRMQQPQQERSAARVRYQPLPNTVVDFHSHGRMPANFSHTDDLDDMGLRISIVIGKLEEATAELAMRLGVYGYHARVSVPEVFTGDMPTDLVMAQNKR